MSTEITKLLFSNRQMKTGSVPPKAVKFFGMEPEIDMPIESIQKYGLIKMLGSRLPLCYFLSFLLGSWSSENLFFYLEAEEYEHQESELDRQIAWGEQIYHSYLVPRAHLELNISEKSKREALEALESGRGLRTCFRCAKTEVVKMLQDSFNEFTKSTAYSQMLTDLGSGKYEVAHINLARRMVKAALKSFVDKNLQYGQNVIHQQKLYTLLVDTFLCEIVRKASRCVS